MSQQPNNYNKKNNRKDRKNKKVMSNEKLKVKINKILGKVQKDIKKKESILKVNKNYSEKLQELLKKVNNCNQESDVNLVKNFDHIQQDRKDLMTKLKKEAKELRKKKKEESKIKRNLKKIEKEEKKLQLESSRIEEFPKLNESLKFINLIIDGWNICGCDKIARKSMRGKRGNGAKRIITLLQLFRNLSDYCNDNINITIHFDGNGKDLLLSDDKISVLYSGKNEIVDDRLVRELSKNISNLNNFKLNNDVKAYTLGNDVNPNRNYIVVTSDRELTIRLNKIGVTCIKSGTFYKKYLKPLAFNNEDDDENNNNNNNKDKDGDLEMSDKKDKRKNKNQVWKKYVKNKTFSDDDTSSSSSSSDSDFLVN